MTQAVILNNFIKYLEKNRPYLEKDPIYRKENRAELTETIRIFLNEGKCYGYSTAYGAFHHTGFRRWWEALLHAIATWDGTDEALNQPVDLPDARQQKQNNPPKLWQLFERAMNHFLAYQGESFVVNPHDKDAEAEPFIPKNIKQDDILEPGSDFFSVIDKNGTLLKVVDKDSFGAHFNPTTLADILGSNIADQLTIIGGNEHAIYVAYERDENGKPKWIIYNSNYDHTKLPISQEFTDEKLAMKEIIDILGNDLGIETASFFYHTQTSPLINRFRECIQTPARIPEFFEGGGLHVMAQYSPEELKWLLGIAEVMNIDLDCLRKAILNIYDDCSGLDTVASYAPHCLADVLNIVSLSKEGIDDIRKSILIKNDNGENGLQVIANRAPHVLPDLLDIVRLSKEGPNTIAQLLIEKDKENCNTLQTLIKQAPQVLPRLFDILLLSKNGPNSFAKALVEKNDHGLNAFHIIISQSPTALSKLVHILRSSKEGPECLLTAMLERKNNGWSGLELIAHSAPEMMEEILNLAYLANDSKNRISKSLQDVNQHDTSLQKLVYYAPTKLPLIINIVRGSKSGSYCIARALINNHAAGFKVVCQKAPDMLLDLLKIACHSHHGVNYFTKNPTTPHHAQAFAANPLQNILTLLKTTPQVLVKLFIQAINENNVRWAEALLSLGAPLTDQLNNDKTLRKIFHAIPQENSHLMTTFLKDHGMEKPKNPKKRSGSPASAYSSTMLTFRVPGAERGDHLDHSQPIVKKPAH